MVANLSLFASLTLDDVFSNSVTVTIYIDYSLRISYIYVSIQKLTFILSDQIKKLLHIIALYDQLHYKKYKLIVL